MNIERKSFQTELKALGDEGIVEAIVSVFNNVDSVGDRVKYGFFDESIKSKLPKGVWQHDWNTPVAKTLEARELMAGDPMLPAGLRDLGGLYIKGQFNLNTQAGRETFSNIKEGIIDEFSIGYSVIEETYAQDGARELVKGRLYEWSPVLFGANPATAVLGVKSGLNDDVETVTSELTRVITRLNERADIRKKEGRTLSSANVARLSTLLETLSSAVGDLKVLIDSATPTNAKALLEMERLRSVINAKRN